jgi:carboxylate-amine ligase
MKPPSLTIGVEEEYQIIDPQTRELQSYITQLLEYDHRFLGQVKPELHQSIVEVGTTVCRTPQEVREELVRLRRGVMELAGLKNLSIAAAGTHPFSHWATQEITPLERYIGTQDAMQDLARQLLIFGTHVHIGIEDRDFLIDAANVARYFLPHILCLSTSSPFWIGRKTGLKSYRSVVFRAFPRSGVTPVLRGWSDYQTYLETLIATNSIPDGSKVWWDVRPHWKYPTLEFRVCDVFTRVDEAVSVAAILQADRREAVEDATRQHHVPRLPVRADRRKQMEAVRYGLDGKLIDFGKQQEIARPRAHSRAHRLVHCRRRGRAGSRKDVEYAYRILEEGSSAGPADRGVRQNRRHQGRCRPLDRGVARRGCPGRCASGHGNCFVTWFR